MSFSDITRWLFSDWTHAVSGVVVALLAYSMIWAMVRASIERVTGRPLARTRLVLVLDVVADVANNLPGALNRVLRAWGHPLFLPAPSASQPPAAPSGRSGEAGRATVATLMLLALVGLGVPAAVVCCGPRPPPSGPGAVVSSWTDTARTVLSTLSWAVPSARAILAAILPEPARTIVMRALDAVAEASQRLAVAVEAYESRGGDRCAAHAAVGGVRAALVQLAQVLADHGVALGTVLERVADGAASIADALVPSCNRDAGWASAGDRTNAELRAIERSATARGVVLRRDLDGVRP